MLSGKYRDGASEQAEQLCKLLPGLCAYPHFVSVFHLSYGGISKSCFYFLHITFNLFKWILIFMLHIQWNSIWMPVANLLRKSFLIECPGVHEYQ